MRNYRNSLHDIHAGMAAWLHGTLLHGNKNGILCRFVSENAVLDIGDLL